MCKMLWKKIVGTVLSLDVKGDELILTVVICIINLPRIRRKLVDTAVKAIFLGYSEDSVGKIYIIQKNDAKINLQ